MSVLSAKQRNSLPTSTFALPSERKYPLPDASHARDALSRVAQNGSPAEIAEVRAKVHARYPGIDQQPDNRKRVVAAMVGKK